ncbi:hypothetical protein SCLCIDRAFT_1224906 [Scleroderma citrinum Foug A]|uniref:Uncharacterized protein n=1 Tax=Scleroderma citrinum Foug A TaxID=1036808 RepID=A0A0C2ZDJ0_9AGAM|nr:hypothetical protein SCLCIDRAFT_1224906 [Scleroderma citrinum Foug A]
MLIQVGQKYLSQLDSNSVSSPCCGHVDNDPLTRRSCSRGELEQDREFVVLRAAG